ncbi:hypothetical protein [Stutzerimonas frequens]|uniref:hypothetical protein n=1 Tax=Stutzerimonas frequens TaxID=2968969 RepID=UPI00190C3386|nr:hypothetical protein [Stutzerimonas frequens]MBK3872376.1 hypothetical protein [Stutzerimonas frequens]MBK3910635.1 hypothetical protein [Stutzerimonas frequens]MBK3929896.1 hypothetical protein [Stutzerimonas frequens]
MSDLSYMWILVKPASGLTPTLLLEAWEPVSIDVQEMSESGMYSVLFSTRQQGQFFYVWSESIRGQWLRLGWMNEAMFFPNQLTYRNTLEGLNEFVTAYRKGMKLHQLTEA